LVEYLFRGEAHALAERRVQEVRDGPWLRVEGLGLGLRVEGLGLRVWGSGFRVWGAGLG
jgi:hypothetical protein